MTRLPRPPVPPRRPDPPPDDRPPTRAEWDAISGTADDLRAADVMPVAHHRRLAEWVRLYSAAAGEG